MTKEAESILKQIDDLSKFRQIEILYGLLEKLLPSKEDLIEELVNDAEYHLNPKYIR